MGREQFHRPSHTTRQVVPAPKPDEGQETWALTIEETLNAGQIVASGGTENFAAGKVPALGSIECNTDIADTISFELYVDGNYRATVYAHNGHYLLQDGFPQTLLPEGSDIAVKNIENPSDKQANIRIELWGNLE